MSERSTTLPTLAGEDRLLAYTARHTEQLAMDILLLYHAAHKARETMAGVLLPLAVSISSCILHYSNVIWFATDREQLARLARAGV